MKPDHVQPISFAGSGPGIDQLAAIPDPIPRSSEQLLVVAQGMGAVDVMAALAIRASLERYVAVNPEASACVWLPSARADRLRMRELLGDLPPRVTYTADEDGEGHDPRVVVPTTPIETLDEARGLAALFLGAAKSRGLGNLRMSSSLAYWAATTMLAILENALGHGRNAITAPLVVCSLLAGSRDVEIAVIDFGEPRDLREALTRSEEDAGGLTRQVRDAESRGLQISLELRGGGMQARWADGGWQFKKVALSPGWAVVATVHRDR